MTTPDRWLSSFADVTTRVHVGLVREPRGHCFVCKLRRVRYRITVESLPHPAQATEARCGECWGLDPDRQNP